MKYYSLSHKGNIRRVNEDSLFADSFFAVVADGMGGHNAGDIASKIAVDTIKDSFKSKKAENVTSKDVKMAIFNANKKVWSDAKHNTERKGMGTTATLAVFKGRKVMVGQVGDSRAYIYRDGSLSQITKDHSYVQTLVDSGSITKDEALYHPQRNIITRAIGTNLDVQLDFFAVDTKKDDLVLLCTDGLISCVTDKEIENILKGDIDSCARRLVDAALDCGGKDNITVVVAYVEGEVI